MSQVSIRDLRNRGGQVLDRVAAGEHLTVTKDGKPVAELRPIRSPRLRASALLRRWASIPSVDPDALRRDLDAAIDSSA
jgi:prevent-host-death family protein